MSLATALAANPSASSPAHSNTTMAFMPVRPFSRVTSAPILLNQVGRVKDSYRSLPPADVGGFGWPQTACGVAQPSLRCSKRPLEEGLMETYVILRRGAWKSPEE